MNFIAIKQRLDLYEKLMRLDKPIGTLLLLWPTSWALWIATAGQPPWLLVVIFALGYALAKFLGLSYENAAPTAMIGASNHFEVAIATATMLYGLSSGAALATVVGVLIEVPLMLGLVKFCIKTQGWFPAESSNEGELSGPDLASHSEAIR